MQTTGPGGNAGYKSYSLFQENKTIWISMFDAAQQLINRIKYRIYEIREQEGDTEFNLDFEIFNPEGFSTGRFSSRGHFFGNRLSADYRMLIPQNLEAAEENTIVECQYNSSLEYPDTLHAGEQLPDGRTRSEIRYRDVVQKTEGHITNRMVVGPEKLMTGYGFRNCMKIRSDVEVISSEKIVPEKYEMTEWFVPHLGIVKMETLYGGMEIDYFGESSGLN